jgi:UTP--glucose-1-phosphate uridylyltransferase
MLPLLDRPMIQFAVEEAAAAGIEQVIIVTSHGKEAMKAYFERTPGLERALADRGRTEQLDEMLRIASLADIRYVLQDEQLGLGHAILCAKHAVGNEPFAVFLPDDIIISAEPAVGQLMRVFDNQRVQGDGQPHSVIAIQPVQYEDISSYGIIDPYENDPGQVRFLEQGVHQVKSLVEKPSPDDAPSDLGIVGRYILTPEIFSCLERTPRGAIGEIQLTDGLALLLGEQAIFAYQFQGNRYDVGTPLGMLKASLALAFEREDLKTELQSWITALQ